jgi:hypothetical protein
MKPEHLELIRRLRAAFDEIVPRLPRHVGDHLAGLVEGRAKPLRTAED